MYNAIGKHDECKRVANEALEGLERISRREHPVARKLKEDLKEWEKKRTDKEEGSALLS